MRLIFVRQNILFAQLISVIGLLAAGFFLEYYLHLTPCILCVLQRITLAVLLVAIVLKFWFTHRTWSLWFPVSLYLIFVGCGLFLSWHHIHLQLNPQAHTGACLPSFEIMLRYFPWDKIMQMVFQGSGGCNEISWRWLGLSIPQWLLICYVWLFILQLVEWFALTRSDD